MPNLKRSVHLYILFCISVDCTLCSSRQQELRKQFHAISELRSEIKSLQSDNLKLYEKVRYMQSYREQASVSQLDPLPGTSTNVHSGSSRSGDDFNKWRKRYEEAMNPFEAFRGRVSVYSSSPI